MKGERVALGHRGLVVLGTEPDRVLSYGNSLKHEATLVISRGPWALVASEHESHAYWFALISLVAREENMEQEERLLFQHLPVGL